MAWSEQLQAWLVTRWAEVTRWFKDAEACTPLAAGAGSSGIDGRTRPHVTGDEHRRRAAIVARRIRNRRELRRPLRARIEAVVDGLLADFPHGEPVEIRTALRSPLPLTVIAELMAMHDAVRFPHRYHDLAGAGVSNVNRDPAVHARGVAAKDEIDARLDPATAARRMAPTDDLLSDLRTPEYEGERLADAEIHSNSAFFLAAGIETTDRSLVSLLGALAADPWQRELLKAEPSLVGSAVVEVLRWKAPVKVSVRQAAADVEPGGATVRAGEKLILILMLGAANRDPEVVPDPDMFDVTRFAAAPDPHFTPVGPLRAFGGGERPCTGSLVAKLEMEVALERLLQGTDRLEIAGDPPVDTGFRRRSAPSLTLLLHS